MKVTLEADDMNLENPDLQQEVVEEAARQMLSGIRAGLKEQLDRAVKQRIEGLAQGMVDEVLKAPFAVTDNYGQPKGPALSMHQQIIDAVVSYMGEKVDREGRADSYGGDRTTVRLVWAANVVANKVIKEAQETVLQEVKATVGAGLKDAITDTVRRILLPGSK